MRVILSFVASADGRVTGPNGEQPSIWASAEDQNFFTSLVRKTGTVIMGRNTYLMHKKHFAKTPEIRRIVMTSDRNLLKRHVEKNIEFTKLSPRAVVQKLRKNGCKHALLASGPRLSAAFLKAKLVDEFYLTVEPKMFGGGLPILDGSLHKTPLSLLSIKKLNAAGTLLLRYKIRV